MVGVGAGGRVASSPRLSTWGAANGLQAPRATRPRMATWCMLCNDCGGGRGRTVAKMG